MTVADQGARVETVGQLREWAQAVLDEVDLTNVRLRSLECRAAPRPVAGPFAVDMDLRFSGQRVDDLLVESVSTYEVVCRARESDREAWSVVCELVGDYRAVDDELSEFTDDQLDAFAMVIGVVQLHPYARETVQSASGRLGYPPFTLDNLTPISAHPDEDEIAFG